MMDAVVSITAYILIAEEDAPNLEAWPPTDDLDEYADRVLSELATPDGLEFAYRTGDEHGDLVSYTYFTQATTEQLLSVARYLGVDDLTGGTLNGGLITGPEEHGYIPVGRTWDISGMDYNVSGVTRIALAEVSVFPLSLELASEMELLEKEEL